MSTYARRQAKLRKWLSANGADAFLVTNPVNVRYLFGFPGIGSALVDAVANRDLPMVQALVLLVAAVYVILNLLADVATILISPRLRTGLR